MGEKSWNSRLDFGGDLHSNVVPEILFYFHPRLFAIALVYYCSLGVSTEYVDGFSYELYFSVEHQFNIAV